MKERDQLSLSPSPGVERDDECRAGGKKEYKSAPLVRRADVSSDARPDSGVSLRVFTRPYRATY